MKKKRIGDLLERLKETVEIEDDKTYKRLTIKINHKGVTLRDTELGANIGTKKQFRVRGGDFILSKIDARQGAFGIIPHAGDKAIITGNFWTYKVDTNEVDTEWFLHFTNSPIFLDLCRRSSTGNTHRKYLDESIFLAHELEIPNLTEQKEQVVKYELQKKTGSLVTAETTQQKSLLTKLKQAILQEAIQGKLTADWRAKNPDTEPASVLLKRIQSEKARLIAQKKIRKEKPLPEITPEEIPFEIPKGWEWCRFGDIVREYRAGKSFKCAAHPAEGDEWGVLKTSAVTSSTFQESENKFYSSVKPLDISAQVKSGDMIFCRASGSKGLAGTAVIVKSCSKNLLLSDKTIRVSLFGDISQQLIFLHNCSRATQEYYSVLNSGKSTTMNNITKGQLLLKPVPLPPLAEQAAIVSRVEVLMATCRELEAEIENSRTHAADLLQAVLKEAFSS